MTSEVRYDPYGQERWANGVAVTDFGFTSQRNEASFGLMDYNARYYSPVLGRFVSPATIVPEPTNSRGFNRYRYVRNNPLKYTDPTGHAADAGYEVGGRGRDRDRYKDNKFVEMAETSVDALVDANVELFNIAFGYEVPDLHIIGYSGRLVKGKGGFEKVYDFDTNEVGFFMYAGEELGSSFIGGELSYYEGIGYKNTLSGQSLEDAYGGGAYSLSGSGGTPLDFISFDGAISITGDGHYAPTTAGDVFYAVPKFDRIWTYTAGGSAGGAWAPPVNVAVSLTDATYLGGTGPLTDQEMITYIIENEIVPHQNMPLGFGARELGTLRGLYLISLVHLNQEAQINE